jgi:hypothetical protein
VRGSLDGNSYRNLRWPETLAQNLYERMKSILLALAAIALPGCISIPIPPVGSHVGALGSVRVSIVYESNNTTTQKTPSMQYAFESFSKTLTDK